MIMKTFNKARNQFILLLVSLFPVIVTAHPGHSAEGSFMHAAEHGVWLALVLAVFAGSYCVILFLKNQIDKKACKSKV